MHDVPETAAAQRSLVNRAPRRRGEENKARYPPSLLRHTYEGHYLERQTSLKMRQGFIYRYCCAPPFLHLPPAATPLLAMQHPSPTLASVTRCTSRPAPCGRPTCPGGERESPQPFFRKDTSIMVDKVEDSIVCWWRSGFRECSINSGSLLVFVDDLLMDRNLKMIKIFLPFLSMIFEIKTTRRRIAKEAQEDNEE